MKILTKYFREYRPLSPSSHLTPHQCVEYGARMLGPNEIESLTKKLQGLYDNCLLLWEYEPGLAERLELLIQAFWSDSGDLSEVARQEICFALLYYSRYPKLSSDRHGEFGYVDIEADQVIEAVLERNGACFAIYCDRHGIHWPLLRPSRSLADSHLGCFPA